MKKVLTGFLLGFATKTTIDVILVRFLENKYKEAIRKVHDEVAKESSK